MILCDMTQRSNQSARNSIQSANSQSANSQSANSYDANCRHLSMSMCMPQMTAEQIEAQIAQIKQDCQAQGLRFTALREQVYRLILLAAQPIGAYELLDLLQSASEKVVAPPTVYRSLDFLLRHGLVHQLNSSKAFFACSQPTDRHVAAFLVCRCCGEVQEFSHPSIQTMLTEVEQSTNFATQSSIIELSGVCQRCQ